MAGTLQRFFPTWILWSVRRGEVTLSTVLLKRNSTTLLQVSLHLPWCSHNCCLPRSSSGVPDWARNGFFLRVAGWCCVYLVLTESPCGGHPHTHGQTSCKCGGSTFQSKTVEFPLAAWLLEWIAHLGEGSIASALPLQALSGVRGGNL